jgi:hypothetical protein
MYEKNQYSIFFPVKMHFADDMVVGVCACATNYHTWIEFPKR